MKRYDVPDMLRLTKILHKRRIIPSCMTCEYFEEKSEFCTKYFVAPPARIIAYGCEGWDDNIQVRAITGDLD